MVSLCTINPTLNEAHKISAHKQLDVVEAHVKWVGWVRWSSRTPICTCDGAAALSVWHPLYHLALSSLFKHTSSPFLQPPMISPNLVAFGFNSTTRGDISSELYGDWLWDENFKFCLIFTHFSCFSPFSGYRWWNNTLSSLENFSLNSILFFLFLMSHPDNGGFLKIAQKRDSISKKTSFCIMVINTDHQESWFLSVGHPFSALRYFLFFVPFPLVLSYQGVTLELWQLLYVNGDPHIIFNNYSKSAKVLASRKIEFQMKKNINVEDNIGVPFGICLKIMLWQKWKGLEMFKFKILNTNIICHKGLYQQLTHIPRISWFNCNDNPPHF